VLPLLDKFRKKIKIKFLETRVKKWKVTETKEFPKNVTLSKHFDRRYLKVITLYF
jgi:hypothetical protein